MEKSAFNDFQWFCSPLHRKCKSSGASVKVLLYRRTRTFISHWSTIRIDFQPDSPSSTSSVVLHFCYSRTATITIDLRLYSIITIRLIPCDQSSGKSIISHVSLLHCNFSSDDDHKGWFRSFAKISTRVAASLMLWLATRPCSVGPIIVQQSQRRRDYYGIRIFPFESDDGWLRCRRPTARHPSSDHQHHLLAAAPSSIAVIKL